MSLPTGIATTQITFGTAVAMVSARNLAMSVTFTPTTSLVWAATGTVLIADAEGFTADPGSQGSVTLINPDQAGFTDGNGNAIRNWGYKVEATYRDGSVTLLAAPPKYITWTAGDSGPLDLDQMIPVTASSGITVSMPLVTSVNGQTGDITLAGSGATGPVASIAVYDSSLQPFASDSVWRLAVAQTATFAAGSDARNTAIANVNGTGGANQAWMNFDQYSHPISYAALTDPSATVTDTAHTATDTPTGGAFQEYVPAAARIAAGYDAHMHVITPDRQYVQEHYNTSRTDATHYTVHRRHQVSLLGSGIGPQNGTRAYGGSAIGGLIRAWEVDPAHPAYTGRIDHPLAVALRTDQMLYTSTSPDVGHGAYDALGYGLKKGYVWPATEQDYASDGNYTGTIAMGSYFAIPPAVDLTTLGLATPQAMMLAKAAQDYGVYVTDTSGVAAFYLEDDGRTATTAFLRALIPTPSYSTADLATVFQALRVVSNNTPTTPNGGTLGAARRGVYSSGYATASTLPRIEHAVTALQAGGGSSTGGSGGSTLAAIQTKTSASTTLTAGQTVSIYFDSTVYTRGTGLTLDSVGVFKTTSAGLFLITANGQIGGAADGNDFVLELDVNYGDAIEFVAVPGPYAARLQGTAVLQLGANDTVSCKVFNQSATNRPLNSGFAISMTRLGS